MVPSSENPGHQVRIHGVGTTMTMGRQFNDAGSKVRRMALLLWLVLFHR